MTIGPHDIDENSGMLHEWSQNYTYVTFKVSETKAGPVYFDELQLWGMRAIVEFDG